MYLDSAWTFMGWKSFNTKIFLYKYDREDNDFLWYQTIWCPVYTGFTV